MVSKVATDTEYWYQWLGHMNVDYISKIVKMIKGMMIVDPLKLA